MNVRSGRDEATTGMYVVPMPTPMGAPDSGAARVLGSDLSPRDRVRMLWHAYARTALRASTYVGLPLLVVIDGLAALEVIPWMPVQLHSLAAVLALFGLLEINNRKRWYDAVTAYRLGHMAGRVDQETEQRERLNPYALPNVLYQQQRRRESPGTIDRSELQSAVSGGSNVVPISRRYDRA